MNRTAVLVLAFLVLGIGIGFLLTQSSASVPTETSLPIATTSPATTTPAPKPTSPTKPTKPATTGTNGFKSIFTQSGSHECKYDQVSTTGRNVNVVYIADGKMRGEFRTVASSNSTGDLMVYNNGYLYVWKEGKTTGTKTLISSISELPHAIPTDLTSGAVLGTNANNVSWDCHTWIKDASLLAPPAYVTFK